MPGRKSELLLELRSEEIPARMQARAADDLKRLVTDGLKDTGLSFDGARAFATPRRLALVVEGLPSKQPDKTEERRGPRADAPQKAVKGFKKSLPKGAKVEKRKTEKGEFHFAVVKTRGRQAAGVVAQVIDGALAAFAWPKSMRWGENQVRWVRPVHGVVCLFGGRVVPVAFGPVEASAATQGHLFLAPGPFKVRGFKDYEAKLEKAKVILDPAERRARIEAEAKKRAKAAGLKLKVDPALLAEVAGLCEWPVVRLGRIDKAFMELPDEVLTTVMRHHQKYFALLDKRGRLAPRFVVVLDTETRDRGRAAVAGNERVLRARLADAKFFWDQDRKRRLDDRIQELGGQVYHAKLDTMLDKTIRVEKLAAALATHCGANDGDARWAARLAKADLSTEMVVEFPELQGVMGRYYALNDGEKPDVADAIAEHYAPQGPADDCPSKPVSVTVALADKIDTLVGFWSIGEKPTGSRDPFALRRAALGVIRLILENQLTLSIREMIATTWGQYSKGQDINKLHAFQEDLRTFIFDRLKVHLRDKGTPPDLIDALFGRGGEDDLLRIVRKAEVLKTFLKTDNGANLLVAYKRANNIVEIESKKDRKGYLESPDENLFRQDEEQILWSALNNSAQFGGTNLEMVEFEIAVQSLAKLRKPVDDFFDHVTVNCDDAGLRENRLRLLSQISATMNNIADFSWIQGGER